MTQTLAELTGKEHTSFSAFTTWLDCGEKFRLQRIENIQEDPAYYLAGGSAVHHGTEVFDNMYETGQMGFAEAATTAVRSFQEYFQAALDERPKANWRAGGRKTAQNPRGEDAAWWITNGSRQVQQYADWRRTAANFPLWRSDAGTLAVELAVDPTFTGGVKVKGYIDRVFQTSDDLVVVDLKSGSREPASFLQLAVYAIAMEKEYGVRPRYGAYFMTRKAELGTIVDLSSFTEAMVARWFRNFRHGVENDIFIPHVTSMCGSCGVRQACYAVTPTLAADIDFNSDIVTSAQEVSA